MVKHVQIFAALGDGNRSRMVSRLAATDATLTQLAQEVAISLPAALKHVKVLEDAGLVVRTKHGRTVTVRLEPRSLEQTEAWLRRTRTFWTTQLGQLAASFEHPPEDRP